MTSPEFPRDTRVMITGTGGAAGPGVLRLLEDPNLELWAADPDPMSPGLYLVERCRRLILPPATDPDFVERLVAACRRHEIDVVVPTGDDELAVLSRRQEDLFDAGITVVMNPAHAVDFSLDKFMLARLCGDDVLTPRTELLTQDTEPWFPAFVKPRVGSGSHGARLVEEPGDLAHVPRDGSYIIQEFLPGDEYSVDVLVRRDGVVVCVVPRTRDRVDAGVAVASRTLHDRAMIEAATTVVRQLGVRGVANVQLRRNSKGRPALLEVNPGMSGSLVVTAAAGANLAKLALADALGLEIPERVPFTEVAIVRHLTETVVPLAEYGANPQTRRALACDSRGLVGITLDC